MSKDDLSSLIAQVEARQKRTSAITSEFIKLVTDGQEISGYNPTCTHCGARQLGDEGARRKRRFLRLASATLQCLANALLITSPEIYVNEAGPAISGDAHLVASGGIHRLPKFQVTLTHSLWPVGPGHDFYFGLSDAFTRNHWGQWDELSDLSRLGERMRNEFVADLATCGVSILQPRKTEVTPMG
jgi:hypothetical protein